jgi:hypothetical protein
VEHEREFQKVPPTRFKAYLNRRLSFAWGILLLPVRLEMLRMLLFGLLRGSTVLILIMSEGPLKHLQQY